MSARYSESHLGVELMCANYILNPIFSENRWMLLELSQNRWMQLHPLTQPNDAPANGGLATVQNKTENAAFPLKGN